MALFWHNHFATSYTKVAGGVGRVPEHQDAGAQGRRASGAAGVKSSCFASTPSAISGTCCSKLREIPRWSCFSMAGQTSSVSLRKNFGREIMELFTFGVGNHTEEDVYAAARVFTGWNLRKATNGRNRDPQTYYEFFYNPNQHDTTAKTFTFPIYGNGEVTIPARTAADGMQDGVDFITALAYHPETARRLARKLWNFFVSEVETPDPAFVEAVAAEYLRNNTEMKPVVRYILGSSWFLDPRRFYARYSWPVEFVVRAIREVGWNGFSINSARTPLTNMGRPCFEPPNVAGWELGHEWFSTGAMLARMNFASRLAGNQRFNLAAAAEQYRGGPSAFLDFFLERLSPPPYESVPYRELLAHLTSSRAWTGSASQTRTKAAGLVKLIVGSADYQFV